MTQFSCQNLKKGKFRILASESENFIAFQQKLGLVFFYQSKTNSSSEIIMQPSSLLIFSGSGPELKAHQNKQLGFFFLSCQLCKTLFLVQLKQNFAPYIVTALLIRWLMSSNFICRNNLALN